MTTNIDKPTRNYSPAEPDRISNTFGIPQYKAEDIPSAPDPNTPRGQIFIAATQLFAEYGFKETTTRAIAKVAGVKLSLA